MSSIRVLVVEDFEPFRQFVVSILAKMPELQVVGEASDGLEAVEKAQELEPDLILLDISLPGLNGIEAAHRICKLSPSSKILFVSQESSPDVVRGALSTGALGYVVKMDAGKELLEAVDAVLRGERFVGSRFARHSLPVANLWTKQSTGHEVGFYSDDRFLLDHLTHFTGTALKTGRAAIVVATESHRNTVLSRLQGYGVDIVAVIEQGRYVALDAAETLSRFMVRDTPDRARFLNAWSNLFVTAAEAAKEEQSRIAVFGECAHLLWAQGNAEAAIQVERLGNQLAFTHDVDILCGYSPGAFQGVMDSHIFNRICAEHSAVHSL